MLSTHKEMDHEAYEGNPCSTTAYEHADAAEAQRVREGSK
jgi:hypothetical protein